MGLPIKSTARWYNNPKLRGIIYQLLLLGLVVFFVAFIVRNTAINLAKQNIRTGFDFFDLPAGFVVIQTLIDYSPSDSYFRVFLVGLVNTVFVALIAIFFSTIIGFTVGIARFSKNWLVNRAAFVYVEIVRNVPLLLQIFVWYFGILGALPRARQSIDLFGVIFLNRRGISFPRPLIEGNLSAVLLVGFGGLLLWIGLAVWSRRTQMLTGVRRRVWPYGLGGLLLFPVVAWLVFGLRLDFEIPVLRGFNFGGGYKLLPELLALVLALSIYTASFISEIVRAGIESVAKGQWEAARSLGLRSSTIMRSIIIPQAMRVIIPPLTNQYLNATKNSTLAIAIGYPDLVAVFAGTTLNQTGQAIEIMFLTLMVYLAISLLTSIFMNWFNSRMAIKGR